MGARVRPHRLRKAGLGVVAWGVALLLLAESGSAAPRPKAQRIPVTQTKQTPQPQKPQIPSLAAIRAKLRGRARKIDQSTAQGVIVHQVDPLPGAEYDRVLKGHWEEFEKRGLLKRRSPPPKNVGWAVRWTWWYDGPQGKWRYDEADLQEGDVYLMPLCRGIVGAYKTVLSDGRKVYSYQMHARGVVIYSGKQAIRSAPLGPFPGFLQMERGVPSSRKPDIMAQETLDGEECLRLTWKQPPPRQSTTDVWLAVNKGMAAKRYRGAINSGKWLRFHDYVLSDFREFPGGLWLPMKCVYTNRIGRNGVPVTVCETMTVLSMEIGKPIPRSVFKPEYPKGGYVIEGALGKSRRVTWYWPPPWKRW